MILLLLIFMQILLIGKLKIIIHDFDVDDHKNYVTTFKYKGKFSLSYYEFDLLGEWPKDKFIWKKGFCKVSAQKGKSQNKGTEILVMNY